MSTSVLTTILNEPISASVVNDRAVNIYFGGPGDNTSVTIPYERIPELFAKISECLPPQEQQHGKIKTGIEYRCIVVNGDVTDEEIRQRLQKNGTAV